MSSSEVQGGVTTRRVTADRVMTCALTAESLTTCRLTADRLGDSTGKYD